MDGWRNPVGDQPPRVYWMRRAVVLVVAVVVVSGIVLFASSLLSGADKADEVSTDATATTASTTPTDPSRPCGADDVTIAVTAVPAKVAADSTPGFSVTVTDVGTSPCTLDSTADGTELAVRSGNEQYYSSTWCEADPGFDDAEWIVKPGDTRTVDLTWSGNRYDDSCEQIADRAAGSYWVKVSIAGIASEEVQFELAG